jgi:hypothetical protein
LSVDHGNDYLGSDEQRTLTADFLAQHHLGTAGLFSRRIDRQNVVHARRRLEVDFHAMDDEDETFHVPLDRQRRLLDTEQPQIVCAGPLHEMQITGVIDDAGEIRVLVIDPLHQPVPVICQFSGKRDQRHSEPRKFSFSCGGTNTVWQALSSCHIPSLSPSHIFHVRRFPA